MREGRKDNIVFDEVHIHSKFFMFFVDNMQKILSYKSMAYRAQLVLMIFFLRRCAVLHPLPLAHLLGCMSNPERRNPRRFLRRRGFLSSQSRRIEDCLGRQTEIL